MTKETTPDEVIGIEAIKALMVAGDRYSLWDELEELLNGDPTKVQRIAAEVGRAAREAMNPDAAKPLLF